MLVKSPASQLRRKMGPFTIIANLPGTAVPDHNDHGYGPLARFDESVLEPGTFISMHEHRNDEIICDGSIDLFSCDRGNAAVNSARLIKAGT